MNLTKNQYWAVIVVAFLLLVILGFLTWKLVNQEVEFDKECPVPLEYVDRCDCYYSAMAFNMFSGKDDFNPSNKTLRFCTCYPGSKKLNPSDLVYDYVNNSFFVVNNFSSLNLSRGVEGGSG